jgi:hypothetical protein
LIVLKVGETQGLRQEIKKCGKTRIMGSRVSKDTLNLWAQSLSVSLCSVLKYVGVNLIFSLKVEDQSHSQNTGPHTKVHKVFDSEDEISLSESTKFRTVNSI